MFALLLAFNLSCRMERLFKSSITRKCPPQKGAEGGGTLARETGYSDSIPRAAAVATTTSSYFSSIYQPKVSAAGHEAVRVPGSPPWKITTCCKSLNIPTGINGVSEACVLFYEQ